jgi:beta-N-acetylhexosaminidase
VGVNLNFAPVLDVRTNPGNAVIGDRALADRAELVATLGVAVVRGLQGQGVAACGKHFPGHGDTSVDSHVDLPIVEHSPERLRAIEWAPFRAAIDAGVASLMTAHILAVALDDAAPATLSSRVVQGALRGELGWDGVVFTDDMTMRAISDRYPAGEAAVRAIAAGCDAVLLCAPDLDAHAATIEALVRAAETARSPSPPPGALALQSSRIDDALRRTRDAKRRVLGDAPSFRPPSAEELRAMVGGEQHQQIAAEMARFLE